MKYTFINENGAEQTVKIPDDFIERSCKAYKISKKEAIEMYLSDEGYIVNPTVAELTEKAAGQRNVVQSGERKKRTRKPDDIKRAIIAALDEFLQTQEDLENVQVTNPERIIAFQLKDDNYELTLSRKRKPKN